MDEKTLLTEIEGKARGALRVFAPGACEGEHRALRIVQDATSVVRMAALVRNLPRRCDGSLRLLRGKMTGLLVALEGAHDELARELGGLHARLGAHVGPELTAREHEEIGRAFRRKSA